MEALHDWVRRGLPALGAAIPLTVVMVTVLSIILTAAQDLELSPAQTASWILALYGLPGLLSVLLALRYRQPLLLTGNLFAIIFISSLGGRIGYAELIGACMLAGVGVALVSVLGLTGRLAAWIPAPIVLGLLAGAIMPFVADLFTFLGRAPVVVGATLLAYLWGRRGEGRTPAILPALLAGGAMAALTAQVGPAPEQLSLPAPVLTPPVFSLEAVATAAPVLVVLMTLQANLPSVIFLQSEGYEPPDRTINVISGVGTLLGSLLGPTAVSLSLPASSLVGGEQAGEPGQRHRAVYMVGAVALLIGVLAAVAAALPEMVPTSLLLALAGLAMIGVLSNALQTVTQGPLLLGPLFAFAIALSEISLWGFGPYFWALVMGMGVSLLLERDELRQCRAQQGAL
ncbi:MAG TPA: benzoate/H(+) symporter BenE family transporter [Candidatus Sulfomarinibacteraceae bacterium]|nr:benzoate/H(+) symporter BenE family transporter [Candidatus Sulfomarinibacteraceae bacterium]